MAKKSLDLIDTMYEIAERAQPITGRGVGYKLFTAGLIPSMATRDMRSVYRLLKETRERGVIPWEWIVDETREVEKVATWSNPEHVEAYQARWPLGTRQRVWLDVLLYTGLRRGDAVRLGRPHARSGSIKTEKNGVEVPVIILPILQATLDAGPCGDLTFIVGENGRPLIKESFGNEFKAACKAAGVPGSAHGVRKRAATRMADNGATEAQLMAVFGWTDAKMAAHYTRTANRRKLAAESIAKLNESGTKCPAPFSPLPRTLRNVS